MTTKISGSLGGQQISLQWESPHQDWHDPAIYAPAIPGVLVALFGFWISHKLTVSREQRKQLLDSCEKLKDLVDSAVQSCTEAWLSDEGLERQRKIKESKRLLQRVGTTATALKKRTSRGWTSRRIVDVLTEISELRRVATDDPFEDPSRPAQDTHVENISAVAAGIHNKVDDTILNL